MSRLCTSQSQACWQERIHKETAARVRWHILHGQKYLKEKPLPRKQLQKSSVSSSAHRDPVPVILPGSKEVQVGKKGIWGQLSRGVGFWSAPPESHRPRETQTETQRKASPAPWEDLAMRKATPSTLQLLFQGISHEGQGRAAYLQQRYKQKPEEKFSQPILSSWEYGWHLGEVMKNTRVPTHARTQPITKSFYYKSSVFHVMRPTDQLM